MLKNRAAVVVGIVVRPGRLAQHGKHIRVGHNDAALKGDEQPSADFGLVAGAVRVSFRRSGNSARSSSSPA